MNRNPIKLLLIDDDEDDFVLTSDYLSEIPHKTVIIDWASSYENAILKMRSHTYDICFLDFRLGSKNGLDLLSEANLIGFDAPIILLTGKGDRNVDENATRLGAADYLIKGELSAEILERSIRYSLERHSNLKALRESEQKFRAIFEQSPDMILIITPTGKIVDINPSGIKTLGYLPDELTGMQEQIIWREKEKREVFYALMEKQGFVNNLETTILTKSQEKKICILSAASYTDTDNTVFYQIILHDISERKKTEKNMLVAEKLASTGRLVTTLAHEVRNPLTNINLSLEVLETEVTDEEQITYLDIIKRNVNRINTLINELLNSARPNDVALQKHAVTKILDQTLEMAYDRILLKNITLEKNYNVENEFNLLLDEPKIKIALLNIIINAVEAMEENTGRLEIGLHNQGNHCIITIADNGSGISQENINRLFEPYFTSKKNGMGLGLAATNSILQSHHASVEVESELGKGTKFIITFLIH
jgi:PAS domain S-box-containing protein